MMKQAHIHNVSRGASAYFVIVAMLFFSGSSLTVALIMASVQHQNLDNILRLKAHTAATAGLELAKYRIDNGYDPEATDYQLGSGTINITTDPVAGTITSVGTVLDGQQTRSMSSNFADDCFTINTAGASRSGAQILGVTVTTTCITTATVEGWTISWAADSGERVKRIRINGVNLYNNVTGTASGIYIDATDASYNAADGTLNVDEFLFVNSLPSGLTYTFQAHFADGSTLSANFVDPP